MRVPVSWLREYVDLPADVSVAELANRLTFLGLKLEALTAPGAEIAGPLLVGRVLDFAEETHSNGKTVRWCQVDVGEGDARGIVCGARNFDAGDLVVVALPGTILPGGFAISPRKAYGHLSDGMICSARELGLGDDHTGILVVDEAAGAVGESAVALLHLRDDVIEFEINPDRAYALSLRGVAREAAIAYGLDSRDPASALQHAVAGAGYPVRVDDPDGCDLFVALEVTGFDPTARSPLWMQRRLQLAGLRPISLAVDVTNYVMLELGNPIHGYDRDALRGEIVVRRASAGEQLTTLDGRLRDLDPEDLLITDDRGPIGIAGVMGGAETELSEQTSCIVIEAAHFDPVTVARSGRRHKLPSEAVKRFERGVDPTIAATAAQRVADLLVRYGGGTVAGAATIVGEPAGRQPIAMAAGLPARVAGFAIEEAVAARCLRLVGCDVSVADGVVAATPPPWRQDMIDPNDLVEEVVRLVGYDKVPSVVPLAPAGHGLTARQRLRRRLASALAGAGYVEAPGYPFVGERDWADLGLAPDDARRAAIRIANPLSEELPLLRTTLLPDLLRTLARNVARSQSDVALYEIGAVYLPGVQGRPNAPRLGVERAPSSEELAALEAALPDQPARLAVALCGERVPRGWWGPPQAALWADAVEAARLAARSLGLEIDVRPARREPWHPGRCAELLMDGTAVGFGGELHPAVCTAVGLPPRTSAMELDLEALLADAVDIVQAPALSSYPVAKEDVALVVPADVPAAEVAAALRSGAGALLESLRLFDVYVGEQAGPGRKSLAFALRFRAPDRTLTDQEVAAFRDTAVAEAGRRVGAVQRA
jgi:phenylalanyl-tRNA synthetase beta chain